MPRSECFCSIDEKYGFSCEKDYLGNDQKFRYVKIDNCITDEIEIRGVKYRSGWTEGSIDNCEIKMRGHDLRSIANDHRKGKSHSHHWSKVKKEEQYHKLEY